MLIILCSCIKPLFGRQECTERARFIGRRLEQMGRNHKMSYVFFDRLVFLLNKRCSRVFVGVSFHLCDHGRVLQIDL